jgi:signal transduction histidine kinase/ActR/RegA family two-component response regulator
MSAPTGPTDATIAPRASGPLQYGAALLIVAAVLGLKLAFLDAFSWSYPFALLYAAVAIAACVGGLGPGLLVTAVAVIAVGWFWVQRPGQTLPADREFALLLFVLESSLIAFACSRLRHRRGEESGRPTGLRSSLATHQKAEPPPAPDLQGAKLEAVGRLAGGIAHDFNNLLTVILGNLDLILEHAAPPEMHEGLLEDVRAAGRRAAVLTRQLLAFSRREPAAPRRIDLNAVVTDLQSMLRRVIAEHITLTTDLRPDLGPVLADPGQIEQVVLNLVVNARDAMPKGGTLAICTDEKDVPTRELPADADGPSGRYVILLVSDTGCGMDAATQARIFEPFFTTKEVGKGTGLGLATVYGNVKQAKGWVAVESKPGAGSTFRAYLPRALGSAEVTPEANGYARPRTGTETILLVEDEPPLRDLAKRALEGAGYTVLACPDGKAAVEAARRFSGPIDLVVTDLVMPAMNGRQLAAMLMAERPGLPVLLMSGYSESIVANLSGMLPEEEMLDKPFVPDDLTRKVREMLDRKQ